MTLLEKIKNDQLTARKAKDQIKASLLTTLIGEAEMIGKNDGNRVTTDSEVVAIIKKFIGNIDFTIEHVGDADTSSMFTERDALVVYLPKQLTEEELAIEITRIVSGLPDKTKKQMGAVMKELKIAFDGQYDGTVASNLVKSMLQ